MVKILCLDYEYRNTRNPKFDVVSVAYYDTHTKQGKSIWLYKNNNTQAEHKDFLLKKRDEGYEILCFNAAAEAGAMISLGINPLPFNWFDIQAEYKMLLNFHEERFGAHLIDDKVKHVLPLPPYGEVKDPLGYYGRPQPSLISCCYKLLNDRGDLEYKDHIRKKIINTDEFDQDLKTEILRYGLSDIKDLLRLRKEVSKRLTQYYPQYSHLLKEEIYFRGQTVVRSEIISRIGYPVDRKKLYNFVTAIPSMLKECQEDINRQFPDTFKWDKRNNRYSFTQHGPKDFIHKSPQASKWEKTAKGSYTLKLEEWTKHYGDFKYDYPEGNYPAQIIRFLKMKQSLNGFMPRAVNAKTKSFFDYYGSDGRAHPYLNPYGAQSARYQPAASGFLHLKAAWMRSLVQPKKGNVIIGIDYGSQEFLGAALASGDEQMYKAYASKDVYLYGAKQAGEVPPEGTREEYKRERDIFKTVTLGMSYGMGAAKLAGDLSQKIGHKVSEDRARELIDAFKEAYPQYTDWVEENAEQYINEDHIKLADGWIMGGGNNNYNSVRNMPIQGMGSCILRKAIQLSQDAGLKVILPLHDALYIESKFEDWKEQADLLYDLMREAYIYYYEDKENASLIRMDIDAWGEGLPEVEFTDDGPKYSSDTTPAGRPVKVMSEYIDERSWKEYIRYKKYM